MSEDGLYHIRPFCDWHEDHGDVRRRDGTRRQAICLRMPPRQTLARKGVMAMRPIIPS